MSDTIERVLDTLLVCLISKSVEVQLERNAEPKKVILLEEVYEVVNDFKKTVMYRPGLFQAVGQCHPDHLVVQHRQFDRSALLHQRLFLREPVVCL